MDFGPWHILALILVSLLMLKSMDIIRSLRLLGIFFLLLCTYGGVTLMTVKTAEELKKENLLLKEEIKTLREVSRAHQELVGALYQHINELERKLQKDE